MDFHYKNNFLEDFNVFYIFLYFNFRKMASAPVPVSVFGSDNSKKGAAKKTRNCSPYKFITRIDGEGMYARFAFFAKTLEEANNLLGTMVADKIFDNIISHAYERKGAKYGQGYSIHGVAHCVRKDYDFFYLRKRLPKAYIRCSFYPDGPQNTQKKQSTEILQEGIAPSVLYNNTNYCMPVSGQTGGDDCNALTFCDQ